MKTRPAKPTFSKRTGDPFSDWARPVIWHLLETQDRTQVDLAACIGVSPKHLNQMLHGLVGINPATGERIFRSLGYSVVFGITPAQATPSPSGGDGGGGEGRG